MRKPICNRILSVILAAAMVMSLLPLVSISAPKALEPETSDQSQAATTPSSDLPWDHDTLHITLSGGDVDSLPLHSYEKVEIKASGLVENAAYQWQVEHPEKDGVWVNVYDGTEKTIHVTQALVENVLRADGTARLRCRAYTDSYAYLSNTVTVTVLAEENAAAYTTYAMRRDGDIALAAENSSEFVTVEIHYVKYEYVRHVDDKGKETYVLEEKGEAYGAYVATIRSGSGLTVEVPNPSIVGYDANLVPQDGAVQSNGVVSINLTDITADVSFCVEYRPAEVPYSVHYYFQNIYDDQYVEDNTLAPVVTLFGYTGMHPDVTYTQAVFTGFTSLFYEPDIIAGDGSTVFNVYYERNYYLMEFDCNGGYGTDTIYVRYGTYVAVADPVRAGYVFGGWDLISTDNSDNTETLGDGQYNVLPQMLPAYNSGYKAIWNTTATTYTVVYWRENADDDGYSYWDSVQVNATSNDHVSATSHTTATGLQESAYFTYNATKTVAEESKRTDLASDGKVIVEGDGSTVVNVYYSRNVYTLQFNVGNNTFNVPGGGHKHGDGNCTYDLVCGYKDHIHSTECVKNLACAIPEHTAHTDACIDCGMPIHTAHTDACLICTKELHPEHTLKDCYSLNCDIVPHNHEKDGCALECIHPAHTLNCYSTSGGLILDNNHGGKAESEMTSSGNGLYSYKTGILFWTTTHYYVKIGENWYCSADSNENEIAFSCIHNGHEDACYTCGKQNNNHSHTDACYRLVCAKPIHAAHTEADGCYRDVVHTAHADSCYKDIIHTHTDDCYTWTCGESAHTHTDDCYGNCIKPENYVEGTGSSKKYYIKAKYNQTIGDVWPTSAHYSGLYGWSIEGQSGTTAVSKKVNMTTDLCDTSDGLRVITANTNSTSYIVHLYYMFESYDQTSPANGNDRKEFTDNGITRYYDKSELYYQDVNAGDSEFSQKNITGMTAVDVVSERVTNREYNNFLYYTRDKHDFSFHNVNTVVETVSNLMYGYPLKDVTVNGAAASAFVPPYPSVYEPGAYEFKGWYTTPRCFDGTEVDWENMAMPDGKLTLYAKWVPVNRNVYFHLTYEDIATDTYWDTKDQYGNPVSYPIVVEHGAVLGTTYHYMPERNEDHDGDGVNDYIFVGWFYMDEDNKKRFAPDTMEIKRDLHLFAEWQSMIDTQYKVEYVLKEAETIDGVAYAAGTTLAVITEGHSTAGRTKTFTAKAGDQLLVAFKNAPVFPMTNTHSILMDADPTGNTYRFEYVLDPEVYYKVRYVDKVTGEVLDETGNLKTNNAIVTEKFKFFDGYVPEQFYIRKVLASDGEATTAIPENVITFYYLPNTEENQEALYNVEYYIKNPITGQYEQKQTEPGRGVIDASVSVPVPENKFIGYAYAKGEVLVYNENGSFTTTESNAVTLTEKLSRYGLVFKVYYDPIQYPYLIKFVEYGKPDHVLGYGKVGDDQVHTLDEVKNEKEDFNSELVYTAPGSIMENEKKYTFIQNSEQEQTLTIRIDDTEPKVNVLTFYYEMEVIPIEYHAVCTVPGIVGGNVSQSSEPKPQNPQGCDAMKLAGFTFEGWYYDEACKEPVPDVWLTKNTDEKSYITPPVGSIVKGEDGKEHFYALFKPIVTELTIEKTVNNDADCDDSFLFHVQGVAGTITGEVDLIVAITGNGEAVIQELYCGEYTVTELTGWSWEYDVNDTASKRITLVENPADNKISFSNTYADPDWLGDESAVANNNFK